MYQNRNDAPKGPANSCLPDWRERKFSEFAADPSGHTKQEAQQPSQQPRDRDREQPPEPFRLRHPQQSPARQRSRNNSTSYRRYFAFHFGVELRDTRNRIF